MGFMAFTLNVTQSGRRFLFRLTAPFYPSIFFFFSFLFSALNGLFPFGYPSEIISKISSARDLNARIECSNTEFMQCTDGPTQVLSIWYHPTTIFNYSRNISRQIIKHLNEFHGAHFSMWAFFGNIPIGDVHAGGVPGPIERSMR